MRLFSAVLRRRLIVDQYVLLRKNRPKAALLLVDQFRGVTKMVTRAEG